PSADKSRYSQNRIPLPHNDLRIHARKSALGELHLIKPNSKSQTNLWPLYQSRPNPKNENRLPINPTHPHKVAYFDYPLDCQVNLTPTDRYARTDE
ncbi:MAG: hypothetical protein U9R15_20235, partial [Chloroflexota bacterium]|nr:hypothetical protein [Chloroflexota bacterium]